MKIGLIILLCILFVAVIAGVIIIPIRCMYGDDDKTTKKKNEGETAEAIPTTKESLPEEKSCPSATTPTIYVAQKKEASYFRLLMRALLIVFLIFTVGFNILDRLDADNDANPMLWERCAEYKDIEIDTDYTFPTDLVIRIEPKEDIDDLVILIECRSGGKYGVDYTSIYYRKFLDFKNVEKGKAYEERISLAELTHIPFDEYTKVTCTIYDGTVSFF